MKNKKQQKLSTGGIVDVMAIGLAVATLFGFLGRLHWFLELFSHFRVQYMQIGLVLIGIALWQRRNKRAIALLLLACLNYAFVLPFYFGKPAPATEKPIRAMLMNLNALNGNTELVMSSITKTKPDLLLLEEVTTTWDQKLKVLEETYPHHITQVRDDCFGIKFFSKFPLSDERVTSISETEIPTITGTIHTPRGDLSFIGTHPLPPIGKLYANSRNMQLAALPKLIQQQKYPVLLVGDLNTSPWSPHFRDLLSQSGLKNSMKGFGFQPTWPSNNGFLRIPLDHILHSPEIMIHSRMIGGDIGSDHFPVIVDFSIE